MPFLAPDEIEVGEWECYKLSVPTNPAFKRSVYGVLSRLARAFNWETVTGGMTGELAHETGVEIFNSLVKCEDDETGGDTDEMACCTDYPPDHPMIVWNPQNPYSDPDLVPSGYVYPPWDVKEAGFFDQIQNGDVITQLLNIPIDFVGMLLTGFINVGFPRFRIHFSGTGKVQLHLLEVPQGGIALISLDNRPDTAQLVDMASLAILEFDTWFNALEIFTSGVIDGGIYPLRIIEANVANAGDHHIDVVMLPQISSDVILGFGGGLRKIALCDGLEPIEEAFMPEMQRDGCDIQFRPNPNAGWQTIFNIEEAIKDCVDLGFASDFGNPEVTEDYCRAANYLATAVRETLHVDSGTMSQFYYTADFIEQVLPPSMRTSGTPRHVFGNWNVLTSAQQTEVRNNLLAFDIDPIVSCKIYAFTQSEESYTAADELAILGYLYSSDPDTIDPPSQNGVDPNWTPEYMWLESLNTNFTIAERTAFLADFVYMAWLLYYDANPVAAKAILNYEANLSAITGQDNCAGCATLNPSNIPDSLTCVTPTFHAFAYGDLIGGGSKADFAGVFLSQRGIKDGAAYLGELAQVNQYNQAIGVMGLVFDLGMKVNISHITFDFDISANSNQYNYHTFEVDIHAGDDAADPWVNVIDNNNVVDPTRPDELTNINQESRFIMVRFGAIGNNGTHAQMRVQNVRFTFTEIGGTEVQTDVLLGQEVCF